MRVDWYGQAAFRLSGKDGTVFIDPFGDMSPFSGRGVQFEYPPIEGVEADLLLVTHEHLDHNGVEGVAGDPPILRSTAGRLESPLGEVLAIASEHDEAAGTERGPNTIFVFKLDDVRVAHFGDFGQRSLRDEQADAIGDEVDLLFIPVGDGPTIGAEQAAAIVDRLAPKWVVPMHYRTHRLGFLEPADAFLEKMPSVERLSETGFDTDSLAPDDRPRVVVPASP
jgi:L-ascorbate metabolism protein UlaG (beta-lactamase superfamily)